MSAVNTTPVRPGAISLKREDSNGGAQNPSAGSDDPRSPGVPRTPGGQKKTQANKTPSKAASTSRAIPEAESPLAGFITQTDASGTPTWKKNNPAGGGVAAGGATGGAPAQGEGGLAASLCCCLQPNSAGSSGSKAGAEDGQQMSGVQQGGANGGGRSGNQSPAGKNKKVPTFNTFHYEDPAHPSDKPILPPVAEEDKGKMCLVLDLDETLVHSSFRAVPNPDYIIPVQIEDVVHHVYVCKRPGVDEYLRRCGERYEVVVYTASLNKYADPLLDKLDVHKVIKYRLFRESCTQYQGNYVKNLSLLGRDLRSCVIVDNSPLSYLFHPENAIGCISWIDQQDDDELRVIQDFCEVVEGEEDVRHHMRHWRQGKSYDVKSAFR